MAQNQKRTKKAASDDTTGAPNNLTAEQLYNRLMLDIEPELTTDVLPDLAVWYADETENERRERMERYAKAFEIFGECLLAFGKFWREQLEDFKKNTFETSEKSVASEEAKQIGDIEQSFSDQ